MSACGDEGTGIFNDGQDEEKEKRCDEGEFNQMDVTVGIDGHETGSDNSSQSINYHQT